MDVQKYISVRANKPEKVFNGTVHTDTNGFQDKELPKAITRLIELIPSYHGIKYCSGDLSAKIISQIGDKFYVFEEQIAVAFSELVKTMNTSIQAAYNKGKEDGKKILIQLNKGDISLKDFDKQ